MRNPLLVILSRGDGEGSLVTQPSRILRSFGVSAPQDDDGQRGFSLIEMTVTLAIVSVLMIAVYAMIEQTIRATLFNESHSDLAVLSQKAVNGVQGELLQTRMVFQEDALGSSYRGRSADYPQGASERDGFVRQAEGAYKRALQANNAYGPAYYNLGLLYLDTDPFPGVTDNLIRLNAAKQFFEQYKNMPGFDIKLYESRTKDVDKAIKRAQKKQKKPSGGAPATTPKKTP